MTYRVFAQIDRGPTDSTPVCVYPWEIAILEEIHGSSARMTTIDQLSSPPPGARAVKPKKMKLIYGKHHPPTVREQMEAMQKVSEDEDPFNDLDEEFVRLEECYGMDKDVPLSVAKKVYGSVRNFRREVQKFRGASPPPNIAELLGLEVDEPDAPDAPEIEQGKAPDEMSLGELRTALMDKGVRPPRAVSRERLIELLAEARQEADAEAAA